MSVRRPKDIKTIRNQTYIHNYVYCQTIDVNTGSKSNSPLNCSNTQSNHSSLHMEFLQQTNHPTMQVQLFRARSHKWGIIKPRQSVSTRLNCEWHHPGWRLIPIVHKVSALQLHNSINIPQLDILQRPSETQHNFIYCGMCIIVILFAALFWVVLCWSLWCLVIINAKHGQLVCSSSFSLSLLICCALRWQPTCLSVMCSLRR